MIIVLWACRVLSLCTALTSVAIGLSPVAEADVSLNLFYQSLAPHGRWFNHKTYGRVWQPNGISRNWRPYTEGRWINTTQYGWYWQADQDWGWAPFHYGRWAFDTFVGWVWLPGTVWSPAWVSWQYNSGYSAWAPLPPQVYWQPQSGLSFNYYNASRIPINSWVVVPQQHFTHRHIHQYALPVTQNNHYINRINNTYNNISINNNHIYNTGVPVTHLEREQHQRVQTISAHETDTLIAHQIQQTNGRITTIPPAFESMNQGEAVRERELAARVMRETQNLQATSTRNNGFDVPIATGLGAAGLAASQAHPTFAAPLSGSTDTQAIQQRQMESQQQAMQQQAEQQRQMEAQQQAMQQQAEQQRQMESQQQAMQQQAEQQRQMESQQQAMQQQAEQQRQMELQQQAMQQQAEQQRQMESQQQAMQQQAEQQRQMESQQQAIPQQAEQQRQMESQQQAMQQQAEQQRQMESQQQAIQQQAEQQRQMESQQQAIQQQAEQQMESQQQQTRQSTEEEERLKRLKDQEGQPQAQF